MQLSMLNLVKVIAFLDAFSIAIVLPLLPTFLKSVDATRATSGLFAVIYAVTQLIGGVITGLLCEKLGNVQCTRLVLFCLGFAILSIGLAQSVTVLMLSQATYGCLKHISTITTLLVTELTEADQSTRSAELSRTAAIASFGTIIGPFLGAYLYKIDCRLPAFVSFSIHMTSFVASSFLMLGEPKQAATSSTATTCITSQKLEATSTSIPPQLNIISNCMIPLYTKDTSAEAPLHDQSSTNIWSDCGTMLQYSRDHCSTGLMNIMILRLLILFIKDSMHSRNLMSYNEDRFGLETFQLGYISSFTNILHFITEVIIVGPVLQCNIKNEIHVMVICMCIIVVSSLMECIVPCLNTYMMFSQLPFTIASTVLLAAGKVAFLDRVPPAHLTKIFNIFVFLDNFMGVLAPIYGAFIFIAAGGVRYKPEVATAHFVIMAAIGYTMHSSGCCQEKLKVDKSCDDAIPASPISVTRRHSDAQNNDILCDLCGGFSVQSNNSEWESPILDDPLADLLAKAKLE